MTLRLYLHQPKVVFRARAWLQGQTWTYPQDFVDYDNVTLGNYTILKPGMTMLIGTTQGGQDLGKLRFRYVDLEYPTLRLHVNRYSKGTSLGLATLVEDAYITVLEEYLVWPKIPQMFGAAIYKDTDWGALDNKNTPPPMANGGAGVAGDIDPATGKLEVAFTAHESFCFDLAFEPPISLPGNFVWEPSSMTGVTVVSGGLTQETVTLRFPPGFYYMYLTCYNTATETNDRYNVKKIPIFARDPANDLSITKFQIISHTHTQIGQEITIEFFQDLPRNTYYDGMLMMLWDDEVFYNPTMRWHMQFIGWHQADNNSIRGEPTDTAIGSRLTFFDVARKLETLPGFPQVLEYEPTDPARWTHTRYGNMLYYLWYLLYYHSTALEVADLLTDTHTLAAYKFVVVGSDRQNLNAQVQELCAKISPDYKMTCSRQGDLRFIPDLNLQHTADRTTTVMDHYADDEWTEISYTYSHQPRVGQIQTMSVLSSNEYDIVGDLEEIKIISCVAPGQEYGQGEQLIEAGERIAFDQYTLNNVEGNRFAKLNAKFGPFSITVPIEKIYRGTDVSEAKWVRLTISDINHPIRELVGDFTGVRGIITEMNTQYDYQPTGLIRTVNYRWEMETSGPPAITVTLWPNVPEDT